MSAKILLACLLVLIVTDFSYADKVELDIDEGECNWCEIKDTQPSLDVDEDLTLNFETEGDTDTNWAMYCITSNKYEWHMNEETATSKNKYIMYDTAGTDNSAEITLTRIKTGKGHLYCLVIASDDITGDEKTLNDLNKLKNDKKCNIDCIADQE